MKLRSKFLRKLDDWSDEKKIKKANDIKRRLKSHYAFSAVLRGYLEKDSKLKNALDDVEKL